MKSIHLPILLLTLVFFSSLNSISQSVNFDWVTSTGGQFSESGQGVILDNSGNIYVVGRFSDTCDFDPGPNIFNLTSTGSNDIFIQKLDNNGNFIWAKAIGGTSSDIANSIAIDSIGNLIITGFYSDSVDFDPSVNTSYLYTSPYATSFILKLDSNGSFIWVKSIVCTLSASINQLAINSDNDIYLVGDFQGTADFDPGISTNNISTTTNRDVFIVKLDQLGDFIWVNTYGSFGVNEENGIALDTNENIIIVGNIWDHGFIKKLTPNGSIIWEKELTGEANCNDVFVDLSNNIVVCGSYYGTIDLDPGINNYNFNTISVSNAFIVKLDELGDFIWAHSIGGGGEDINRRVNIDSENNIYVLGNFQTTVDFDHGLAVNNLTGNNTFIQKIDSNSNFIWAKSIGNGATAIGHDLYLDQNNSLFFTGIFLGTGDFDPSQSNNIISSVGGNADFFVEKLSSCTPIYFTETINECDSITWVNGITYSTNNNSDVFNFLSGASDGCDSIVTLDLNLNQSSYRFDSIIACVEYTWIDGITYTSSNDTATYILMNSIGCDSIINLNIEIEPVNTSLTIVNSAKIKANSIIASYQWLDCDNDFSIIQGETNQSFIATLNGSYAVEITENGCIDTSNCVDVSTLNIIEYIEKLHTSIFPNPSNGLITISTENSEFKKIRIYNTTHQIIFEQESHSKDYQIQLNVTSGIYFVEIESQGVTRRHKIVIIEN